MVATPFYNALYKLQATECYINRSSWYLYRSMCCKMGNNLDYLFILVNFLKITDA